MKNFNLNSLLLILFFATALSGCTKDHDILPVSDYLKNMIPYKNGQIVKFISSNNEEIEAKLEIKESIENCTTCQPVENRQVLDYTLRNTANVDCASGSLQIRSVKYISNFTRLP